VSDFVPESIKDLLLVGGVVWAAGRTIFGAGSDRKHLDERLDKIEANMAAAAKIADEERVARRVAEAKAQERAIEEAAERATAKEREKNLTEAVRALRERVEDLVRDTEADHEDVVQRLTNVEGRIGGVERRLSGQMPAVK